MRNRIELGADNMVPLLRSYESQIFTGAPPADAPQGTEGSRSQEPSTPRSVNRIGTFILFEENGPAFLTDEVSCLVSVL